MIGGFGLGLCFTPLICCLALYFHKHRIMATALSSIGSGIGTMLFAPIIQSLADEYGWRGAMLILGGVQLHLCVCGALLRPLPQDVFRPSASLNSENNAKKTSPVFQFEVLINKKVVILMCNVFLICLGFFIVILHLSAYAITQGASHVNAALLVLIVGMASILSRLLIPAAATDSRVGVLLMYTGSLGVTGMVVLLTPFLMPYPTGQVVAAFFFGFYGNGNCALMPTLVAEFAGLRLLTAACGMVNLAGGLGTLLGPPLAGWIYDLTNHYKYGFYVSGSLYLASSIILFLAPLVPTTKSRDDDVVVFDDKEAVAVDDVSQSLCGFAEIQNSTLEVSVFEDRFNGSSRAMNISSTT